MAPKEETLMADEALLAELGYKQELKRHFTMFEVFGLSCTMTTLVPGIASVLYISIPNGGPASMVWGWLVAGVFITFVALAISELASAAPTAGGLYYWTHSFASPRTRNLLSWIVGYFNTMYLWAGVSSISWAIALQISACATIGSNFTFVATQNQLFGIFVAVLVAQGIVASFATRILARLQNLYIAANMLILFGLIIAMAVATPKEFHNTAKFAFTDFDNLNGWPNAYAFFIGFLAPLWVIAGFDTTVHLSEEASNANIAVPWATVFSTVTAVVLGWVLNIVIALFMGTDLVDILATPIGQPMGAILFNSLGNKGTLALFSLIVILLFATEANFCVATSRQMFAFARDGALPFSGIIYKLNSFTGTPVNAVWFATFIAFLLGLLTFAGVSAINAVFALSIGAQYVAYIIPIASRWIFKNDFKPGPFHLGFMSFPVAVVSVVWMSFMIIVFVFPSTPDPNTNTMNYTVVVMVGWLFVAVAWYYFPVYGGVHWFTGPVSNIEVRETKSIDSISKHSELSGLPKQG